MASSIPVISQITPPTIPASSTPARTSISPPSSTRRTATASAVAVALSALLHPIGPFRPGPALALDGFGFGFVAPDQTIEEARETVRYHARDLAGVKDLIEAESWKDLQTSLRRSSASLKQDLHTIIQSLPPERRPHVRRLYSSLFNNVTGMDYAARSKNLLAVQEHYHSIVAILNDIFARI